MAQNRVTIKDIAKELGISSSLVSFVMNNRTKGSRVYRVSPETEKKVLETARRLNYQPNVSARVLRCKEARLIGVIISDIANKFYAEISRYISDWASNNGYMVIFGSTDENTEKLSQLLELFDNQGVDGYIIVPCEGSQNTIAALQDKGKPFVLVDRDFTELGASSVTLNNFQTSRQLLSLLVARGCRKVSLISYNTTLPNIEDREKGYLSGISAFNLEFSQVLRPDYGDYAKLEKMIVDAVKSGVDGFIFTTYRMALLGRKAMIQNSIRVPEDCHIACFNNNEEFETYEREVTFARQPVEEFAVCSIEMLVDLIRNRNSAAKKIVLRPEIIQISK